jgi:hypothetical protein
LGVRERERERGIREWLVRNIEEKYARTKNKVKVGEKEGEWFETTKGVRQGCPLSLLLFTIFSVEITYGINSIISKLMIFVENAETDQFLFLVILILSYFTCS